MKKWFVGFFSILAAFVFSFRIVSASIIPSDFAYAVQDLVWTIQETLRPVLEAIIGGYSSSEFLFAKGLLLIMLFVICQFSIKSVPKLGEQKNIVNIISAAVSILAVRYIQDTDLINGILLPYGVFGVVVTTIIPFVLYFFIVNKVGTSVTWRRIAWIFFGICFAVLWVSRSEELSPLGNQIYGWTLAALVFVFLFDKHIHDYFAVDSLKNMARRSHNRRLVNLEMRIADLQRFEQSNQLTDNMKAELKALQKDHADLIGRSH